MENTVTPVLTQTGYTAATIKDLAHSILRDKAQATGREISSDPGTVASFIDFLTESLGRKIAELNFDVLDFPLDEPERERIDCDALFGDHHPSRISRRELDDALAELDAHDDLDEDEKFLRDDVTNLLDNMGDSSHPWLEVDDGVTDYLNESIPYDLPDWINEGIDWDSLYTETARRWTKIEVGFGEYVLARF